MDRELQTIEGIINFLEAHDFHAQGRIIEYVSKRLQQNYANQPTAQAPYMPQSANEEIQRNRVGSR